jgi:hypothetical protein
MVRFSLLRLTASIAGFHLDPKAGLIQRAARAIGEGDWRLEIALENAAK